MIILKTEFRKGLRVELQSNLHRDNDTVPAIIPEQLTLKATESIDMAGVGIGEGSNDIFLNTLTDINKEFTRR